MITFPSVLHPDKFGYRYEKHGYNFDKRGNWPVLDKLTVFETYGDGMVQHSGEWCAQCADFTDACLSLATAILADPANEEWNYLADEISGRAGRETIEFALSVVFKDDGKARFYSPSERKVTTADKRHDKRFFPVESWCNGSESSALRIVRAGQDYPLCVAEHIGLVCAIRDVASGCGCWEDVLGEQAFRTLEASGDWHQAFRALRAAAQAASQLHHAARCIECATRNSKPKATAETVAT